MIERMFPYLKIKEDGKDSLPALDENSADALAVAICHSMQKRSKIFLKR